MTSSLGIPPLTEEQKAIVDACPRPNRNGKPGALTRVTAAAGTGKTTTLLAIAVKATTELGHDHITYVTFTKAAAADGKKRLAEAVSAAHNNTNGSTNGNNANSGQAIPRIDASTLHSCAHRLLQGHLREEVLDEEEHSDRMWSDKQIQAWIEETCKKEITAFLKGCSTEIGRRVKSNTTYQTPKDRTAGLKYQKDKARSQVIFFIYKSLVHFCQSSWTLQEYAEGTHYNRDYFPIKLFHAPGGNGEDYGFPMSTYNKKAKIGFYAEQAAKLWRLALSKNIRCYNFEMKRVQLLKLRVPGSLILVDESQDMDACQIDWIAHQQTEAFGTPVTVVGDPAQAIYGFRGAKPQYLMQLPVLHDYMLTESWRFGPAISNIANVVLYSKQQSPQTPVNNPNKNWIPYRTRSGLPNKEALVTTQPLISQWKSGPVTVIARTNAKLFLEILPVLGFSFKDDETQTAETATALATLDDVEAAFNAAMNEFDQKSPTSVADNTLEPPFPLEIPKVHVFGRGEASGLKLWRTTLNLVESIYDMYAKSKAGFHETLTTLDKKLFPEFAGRPMTWSTFTDECEQKEISRYSNVIRVVNVCKEKTLAAMEAFREHVLDKTVPQEKADIVLVTCHSAKGMEWDNVQLCDDFIHLCAFSKVTGTAAAAVPPSSSQGSTSSERSAKNRRLADAWQFDFESWGDDVNLAYVACTRAKRILSIPPCIHSVLLAFDNLHSWKYPELLEDGDEYVVVKPGASKGNSGNGGTVKTMAVTIPGCGKEVMTEEKAHGFYDSLVEPLRDEFGMDDCKQLLMKTLINHHLPVSEDAKVKRESLTSE